MTADVSMEKATGFNGHADHYFGLFVTGPDIDETIRTFWAFTCPCKVTTFVPLNGMPTVDTPHPCGHPRHWLVCYRTQPKEATRED